MVKREEKKIEAIMSVYIKQNCEMQFISEVFLQSNSDVHIIFATLVYK